MLIAQKLIKENIAEYVLYMWNVEDIIRAYGLDIDKVNQELIAKYQVSAQERTTIKDWYESLIDMMRAENVSEKGHLQLVRNIIIDLNEMHQYLLQSGKEPAYSAKFYHILPSITLLKGKTTDSNISDIEMCFVFLYGILNLRRSQQDISLDTQQTMQEISKFMILLSANYKKWKTDAFAEPTAEK